MSLLQLLFNYSEISCIFIALIHVVIRIQTVAIVSEVLLLNFT